MVMHVKACCWCCSLRAGTFSIGLLCGFGSLIMLVFCTVMSSALTGQLLREAKLLVPQLEDTPRLHHLENKVMAIVFAVLAVVYGIQLIFSILLVFGVSSERTALIKPWIIFTSIVLTMESLLLIVYIILLCVAMHIDVAEIVRHGVGIAITSYFFVVVNSFHTELSIQKYNQSNSQL